MPIARRQTTAMFAVLATVLAAASLTCGLFDMPPSPGGQMSAREAEALAHVQETGAALGLTQQAIAAIQAERAAQATLESSEAADELTAQASGTHVPVITDVDFPAVAPINVQANGLITFTDAGRDVTTISIQTIEGTFGSGSRDATKEITWAGSQGTWSLVGICGKPEFVRSILTLRDAAGNVSDGYTFAFYCQ